MLSPLYKSVLITLTITGLKKFHFFENYFFKYFALKNKFRKDISRKIAHLN